jgi:hypothetical protein
MTYGSVGRGGNSLSDCRWWERIRSGWRAHQVMTGLFFVLSLDGRGQR